MTLQWTLPILLLLVLAYAQNSPINIDSQQFELLGQNNGSTLNFTIRIYAPHYSIYMQFRNINSAGSYYIHL